MTQYTFTEFLDFTRTTPGTYTDSDGLIKTTAASKNLWTYTQEFTQAAWTKTTCTATSEEIAAPDDTPTANLITSSSTSDSITRSTSSLTANATYTISFFVKKASSTWLRFVLYDSGNSANRISGWINMDTTAAGSATNGGTGTGATISVSSEANGWTRISLSGNVNNSATTMITQISTATADLSTTGVSGATYYLWGAQLELSSSVTSYTRNYGGLYPPRYDYDPVTLAARGLLIEEERTNQLKYSEQINNAAWTKTQATINVNATTSPDGTSNADTIVPNTVSDFHQIYQTGLPTLITGESRVFSAMMSASGYDRIRVSFEAINGFAASARLDTGVIYDATGRWGGAPPTRTSLTPLNNDWSRMEMAGIFNASNNGYSPGVFCYVMDNDGNTTFIGDGTSGLKWWGLQVETGAFATSYIPTTATSATRAADNASISGRNFSSWWSATSGTVIVQSTSSAIGTRIVWQTDDGTSNNRITIYTTGTTVMIDVVSGGITQASLNIGTITANTAFKIAMRYAANDFSASLNGAACVIDTSGTVPVVDRCHFGSDATGNYICAHLMQFKSYPSGVANATLQSLST